MSGISGSCDVESTRSRGPGRNLLSGVSGSCVGSKRGGGESGRNLWSGKSSNWVEEGTPSLSRLSNQSNQDPISDVL